MKKGIQDRMLRCCRFSQLCVQEGDGGGFFWERRVWFDVFVSCIIGSPLFCANNTPKRITTE